MSYSFELENSEWAVSAWHVVLRRYQDMLDAASIEELRHRTRCYVMAMDNYFTAFYAFSYVEGTEPERTEKWDNRRRT